ncbi:MAG: restriction endonuclease subunit S [Pseudarcicella sp.]|nr:restriction endonuclease subunit S [Pseudarcicella sp.]
MEKLKNIPSLRFPEFNGNWELKRFGEVATNKTGKYNPEKETESVKCIELEHLSSESSKLLGFIDGKNSGSIKNKFDKGDVLFGKLRPYLKKYLLTPFEGVCSSEIWVLKGINISNDFLFRVIQTDKFIDIANQSSGSKMPRADWSVVENGVFSFPKLPEQTKIASFLTSVDDKLQALKQKKTLLGQYKKGVMQKIFSQELRFKDDNGNDYPDWEEKKLGDIGETYNGLTGKSKEHFGDGKPYIQYKQIFDDSKIDISRFELVKISPTENQNKVVFGDVFFTVSSETPNEIGTASVLLDDIQELYLNSFCFGYRASNLYLSPYFSRYLFRNELFRNQIIKLAQGSTRFNMSKVQLMKLTVKLPCIEEQTKIANFLSAIDDKINHCEVQIEKTEVWKKGLLQQMFV